MTEKEFYTKTNFRKLTNDMAKTAEKIRQDNMSATDKGYEPNENC